MKTHSFKETTLLLVLTGLLGLQSCTEDGPETIIPANKDLEVYADGFLILHEGQFFGGNASVSLVSADFETREDNLFSTINGRALGDVAQSMAVDGEEAYIVVNNSQKVEVVNKSTLESVGTVDGTDSGDLLNPRFMAFLQGKGYVTNWGSGLDPDDDFVAEIDLNTLQVLRRIAVEEGPEAILGDGNRLYVAHQGGFSQNNIISVISSDGSITTVNVGDVPNSMQFDEQGNLWVLCGGIPAFTGNETAGSLYRISLSDLAVELVYTFDVTEHPNFLNLDNGDLYFAMGGAIYEFPLGSADPIPTELFSGVNYYGLRVEDGTVYGVDASDFASRGTFEVRDIQGSLISSVPMWLIPSKIYRFQP